MMTELSADNHPFYLCPVCQQPLTKYENHYRCVNGHSHDIAKEGYVNLLPVHQKNSKQPGDSPTMINARRRFLATGHYQALADSIQQLLTEFGHETDSVLDLGCGEGYYSRQLQPKHGQLYGVDISKAAIKKAAKSHAHGHYAVASAKHLPFADQFFKQVVSIYAPIWSQELKRVLTPNGLLLMVSAGPDHLTEIKAALYQQPQRHQLPDAPFKTAPISEQRLQYTMQLDSTETLLDLINMTPFSYKLTPTIIDELSTRKLFACQADFILRLYRHN